MRMCIRVALICAVVAAFSSTTKADLIINTGSPDGLMAMATRPGPATGANQETEAADDFIISTGRVINQATFTGLVPLGTNLATDISQVVVEIYRVFPNDSNAGRMPNVPTRNNSPSDVELDDRNSASGNLTFTTTLLNASFRAGNSVDTGIHPSPNQTTMGEGPVTGQEVQFNVTFTTPFSLPADHYFFVPQVLLSNANNHFLWLSAPKPITGGTGPFVGDLQAWIRNDQLQPDWLRVGTDIVGGNPAPQFNAAFSVTALALVPEPSSLVLGGTTVLLGLGCAWLRRRASAV
jgi:hypothetical protein